MTDRKRIEPQTPSPISWATTRREAAARGARMKHVPAQPGQFVIIAYPNMFDVEEEDGRPTQLITERVQIVAWKIEDDIAHPVHLYSAEKNANQEIGAPVAVLVEQSDGTYHSVNGGEPS
jgi:hypothetical protein